MSTGRVAAVATVASHEPATDGGTDAGDSNLARLAARGPTTLRTRLTMVVLVIAAIAITAALFALRIGLTSKLQSSLDRDQRARVDRIVVSLSADGTLPKMEPFAQVIAITADNKWSVLSRTKAFDEPVLLNTNQLRLALSQPLRVDVELEALGGRARLLAEPKRVNNTDLVVVVGSSLTELDRTKNNLIAGLILSGLVLASISSVGAWLLAGAVLRPVQRMTDEAAAIATSTTGPTLRRRLELPSRHDEIAHLGATFNNLLDRVESAVRREREFVDDASHELRTPLTVLRGELELAAAEVADPRSPNDPEHVKLLLERLSREVDRLSRMAEDLLVLARARTPQESVPASIELLSVATRVAGRLSQVQPSTRGKILTEVTGKPCNVAWRADHAERVLTNLIDNATRFSEQRVVINIDTTTDATDALTRWAIIAIDDDGPGFSPEFIPKAFERFAIADRARTRSLSGTGLGLAIVRELTEAAGGSVCVDRGLLGGARVTVRIPLLLADSKR